MSDAPHNLELIVGAWRDVLGLEEIRYEDDFFELGGHSLLLLEVLDHIEATIGVQIPVRVFFEYPTPLGLADFLETSPS